MKFPSTGHYLRTGTMTFYCINLSVNGKDFFFTVKQVEILIGSLELSVNTS